jgi:hypothetical protein
MSTGSRSLAGVQNLFAISARAGAMFQGGFDYNGYPLWFDYASSDAAVPISYPLVQILAQTENAAGIVYVTMPAGETLDATPVTSGVAYSVSSPMVTPYLPLIKCEATIPTNRARTTIGVGEYVDISFNAGLPTNAVWTTSAGSLDLDTGLTNRFTAPSNAAMVTVTAAMPGIPPININFTVLAPTGVVHTELRGVQPYDPYQVGAGMILTPYFGPTNVSFARVQGLEVGENADSVTGYFTTADDSLSHTTLGANQWFLIETNNSWEHFNSDPDTQWDNAYCFVGENPGRSGTFSWTIPGLWKVGDNGPTNSLPYNARWYQDFILSPNGDFEISKFGWDVTRHLDGTYTTNHVGR